MTQLQLKINNLQAGDFSIISKTKKFTKIVERSGDGKKLRFVELFENGFQVLKETDYSQV